MALALVVTLVALGFIAIVGTASYLLDKSAERHEHRQND